MNEVKTMKNEELLTLAKQLVVQERKVQVAFLKSIYEIDRRRLYASAGYSGLYRYLLDGLKFSEISGSKRHG